MLRSPDRVNVVVSPRAMICPPGWAGFVVRQGRAIVTAPSSDAAAVIRGAIAELSVEDLVDPGTLGRVPPLAEVLGPATPAYIDERDFQAAAPGSASVDRLSAEHPDLRRLEILAGEQESEESGLRAPQGRGRGSARLIGSAAVAHTLEVGLLPQWRARTPQPQRVASALGFRELGVSLS